RGVVLCIVLEDALELALREARMLEAKLHQLVEHDLAADVLARRNGPSARVSAEHGEDALGLAPRVADIADAVGRRAERSEEDKPEPRACMRLPLLGEADQRLLLERPVRLEERIHDVAERDRRRLAAVRAAVHDDQVDQSLALQLVDAGLRVD